MSDQDIQQLRRNVVRYLAELTVHAELGAPSLAARNVCYHAEQLCESMDRMFSGRGDEPTQESQSCD